MKKLLKLATFWLLPALIKDRKKVILKKFILSGWSKCNTMACWSVHTSQKWLTKTASLSITGLYNYDCWIPHSFSKIKYF